MCSIVMLLWLSVLCLPVWLQACSHLWTYSCCLGNWCPCIWVGLGALHELSGLTHYHGAGPWGIVVFPLFLLTYHPPYIQPCIRRTGYKCRSRQRYPVVATTTSTTIGQGLYVCFLGHCSRTVTSLTIVVYNILWAHSSSMWSTRPQKKDISFKTSLANGCLASML